LSILRRAHDHHRDLRTRLPAAAVAHPIGRARQLMTVTTLSPSPITASTRRSYLPAASTLRPQRASPPPSADKPRAPNTNSPRQSHPERPKPAPGWSLHRRPVRSPQIRSSSGDKFPIDRHQRRCELSRGFLPRGFSDACLRAPHASASGRHPKTLNRLRRSPACRRGRDHQETIGRLLATGHVAEVFE
jgi:hypothetical protein